MSFCTSIHCMDGRVQRPLFDYIARVFGHAWVDSITIPGANKVLAEQAPAQAINATLEQIAISRSKHGSELLFISGHHDCAANPIGKEPQIEQIKSALSFLQTQVPEMNSIGLWIDDNWVVHRLHF
ncbi:MAG: carbonic anhydrase [Thermodesulfobacteriota bacterium]